MRGVLVTFDSAKGPVIAERRMEILPRKGDRLLLNGWTFVVDEVAWDFRSAADPQITLWLISDPLKSR